MAEDKKEKKLSDETIPIYPDHAWAEAKLALVVLALAIIVAFVAPPPAHMLAPADPLVTQAHAKPEWYFLALYEMLKYIPGWLGPSFGAFLPLVFVALLFAVPWLDWRREDSKKGMQTRLVITIALFVIVMIGTIIGGRS